MHVMCAFSSSYGKQVDVKNPKHSVRDSALFRVFVSYVLYWFPSSQNKMNSDTWC